MLSQEQRDIIENSIWVVNAALKNQGLQTDKDLKQSAILYMCKCLQNFDKDKHIKWTTYAYKNVYLYIKRTNGKKMLKQSYILNEDISNIKKALVCNDREIDLFNANRIIIERIKSVCNEKELKVLELKLKGYKIAEISSMLHCSNTTVVNSMQKIRTKAQNLQIKI